MEQISSTVAVMTDDPALHERVHNLLSSLNLLEVHCFEHGDIRLADHAAPDLIVIAVPRDQIHELAAALDPLAHDPALAHLPMLVYVPEAEQAGLLEACVGGAAHGPPGCSSLRKTGRSLDGLPGGREDL